MKIIIIGAGIGGTTLALALQRAGLDFVLLEQAEAFGEIGAGIQLSSNAVKVLARLGLEDRLATVCCEPASGTWASAEASMVRAARSSGSSEWMLVLPQARAIICASMVRQCRKL